jgi:hypothetical protein
MKKYERWRASLADVDNCALSKLRPACIFNNFIKLLAAPSGDVVRRVLAASRRR